MARHPLPGSERRPMPGAQMVGKAEATEVCRVSVILRHGAAGALHEAIQKLSVGDRSANHVRREDFAAKFGAGAAGIAAVRQFASAHGLAVMRADAARRTVVLSGTVAACNEAFGVELLRFEHPGGTYRGRTGPVHLPDALQGVVEAVLGLDNRPVAKPYCRWRSLHGNAGPRAGDGAATWFNPGSLATLYGFPHGDGKGQCVGVIELGGGYSAADLNTYFTGLGIDPAPKVVAVPVDGAGNLPTGNAESPDGEVMLDIEVLGAIAPGARIAVYFAPNTDAGFLNALTAAVHDTVNRPSVLSISWGGPEPCWTPQAMTAFDTTLQAAAVMGITVCAAAGDSGSGDGDPDGGDHTDFPASSPHVLACGGTSLTADAAAIVSEVAWNDAAQGGGTGGGGVSSFFALPEWQAGLSATKTGKVMPLAMRGVPDVSGNADPETGYTVRVDGANTVMGGTSAVAPLWAGLLARINAAQGRSAGFINPLLYRAPAALRDITQGNNGDYQAAAGWDACTGLGSPNGAHVVAALVAATTK